MLLVLLTAWMTMATPLSPEILMRVKAWQERDDAFALLPGHRSAVHLAAGDRKTRLAVVVVQGLYNSPHHMNGLAEHFAGEDLNVLNLRLSGHFEVDPGALGGRVRGAEWRSEVAETISLARHLGERVLLVGHSTGALLVTWNAIDDPRDVAGLVLLAPAFKVTTLSRVGAYLLHRSGLVWRPRSGRVVAGHAGLEVDKLAREFRAEAAPLAPDRLRDVPVWMLNTRLDLLIRVKTARDFLASLQGEAPREEAMLGPCARVLHDQLVGARGWATRVAALDQWLTSIAPE